MRLQSLRGNRIMVAPLEEVKESTIILTTVSKDIPIMGRVLMVGDEAHGVSEHQIVLHSKFAGQEIDVDGEKVMVMQVDSIIGIVDPQSVTLPEGK